MERSKVLKQLDLYVEARRPCPECVRPIKAIVKHKNRVFILHTDGSIYQGRLTQLRLV